MSCERKMTDTTEGAYRGLSGLSANPDSQELAAYYDAWAKDYDQTLASWNYRSPAVAAELLARQVPRGEKVLDAGCGTGLSGKALQAQGFQHVIGMDISQASLDQAAQTGAYARLVQVNMQDLPLPFEDDGIAGLLCVGVLTYLQDTEGVLQEFCRIVCPGGVVVFSQRDDLFGERDCAAVLQRLEDEGVWARVFVSEPQPYLPDHEEYADSIRSFTGFFGYCERSRG